MRVRMLAGVFLTAECFQPAAKEDRDVEPGDEISVTRAWAHQLVGHNRAQFIDPDAIEDGDPAVANREPKSKKR
jgi:hypothetical protein